MKRIVKSLAALAAACIVSTASAAVASYPLDPFPSGKLTEQAALQNGAKLFVNYCLNCHSAAFMRFNRLQDIGISEQQIKDNLLVGTDRVGDNMIAALPAKDGKEWFGAQPPDLTLIARSRSGHGGTGADYLYTFLRTFYRDPEKPTGWNNLAFPSVGMPHALWELQGERAPRFDTIKEHGQDLQVFRGWNQVSPGAMTPLQYDEAIGDLVGFLQWMGEPNQNQRVRIGAWVLLFLGVLTVIFWRLNAAFWKDVK